MTGRSTFTLTQPPIYCDTAHSKRIPVSSQRDPTGWGGLLFKIRLNLDSGVCMKKMPPGHKPAVHVREDGFRRFCNIREVTRREISQTSCSQGGLDVLCCFPWRSPTWIVG